MIPYTDYEKLLLLEELERGEKIIRPISLDHAMNMLHVAQCYIDEHREKVLEILKK